MTIRVVVADDQEIIRTGLRMILNAHPDIEVVGEAADGREAVALARRLRPDVCLFASACLTSTASKPHDSSPGLRSTIRWRS